MFNFLSKVKPHQIALYTALFGGRDDLRNFDYSRLGHPVYCFVDRDHPPVRGVSFVKIPALLQCPTRSARMLKLLPHLLFSGAQYTIWFDGNFEFRELDPEKLIKTHLAKADLASFAHPERNCAYQEIDACRDLGRDDPKILEQQRQYYMKAGLPKEIGLISSGFLIRRHTPELQEFCNAWWQQLVQHSRRDQISFSYLLWKMKFSYQAIPGNVWDNEIFICTQHSGQEAKNWLPNTAKTSCG